MDRQYLQILAQPTPPSCKSVTSSYLKKCLRSQSAKKGLSFSESDGDHLMVTNKEDLSTSNFSHKGDSLSNISGVFELENSKYLSKKGDFTVSTRGEFDTTVFVESDVSAVIDSLFESFLEFFIGYSGEHEIFNLLENYENLCCRCYEEISKQQLNNTNISIHVNKMTNLLDSLRMERNIWRLLRILFQDRLESEGMEEEDILPSHGHLSDKQISDNLYMRNPYVRQSQLIIDWLEKNADEDSQQAGWNKLDGFTDNCLALENTLNELLTEDFNGSLQRIVQIDPDALFRDELYSIHETDKANQARVFKFMFAFIRAGKLHEAQNLAERFGEAWLAAALEGWRLHHDPNYEEEVVEGQLLRPIEGNKYRDLWKAACWRASEAPMISVHEQALYGSLCGNMKSVLAVCKSWEDYLWAYMRCTQDKLIEREIRCCSLQENFQDLPFQYWDKVLDIEEIFHEIEASDNIVVKDNARNRYNLIQKYIILDDIDGLIEEMYSWVSNEILDNQILRCMTHIVLFLRVIGRSTKEELCVPILEAYVQELIKLHKVSLVAPYTSTLPKELQVMWYSKFLEGISENEERQKCLQYAEDAGLDVPVITTTVVKFIREKENDKPEITSDLTAVTTEDDVRKIHAIDWLIFSPNQRPEAMKQANALMRHFVAERKLEAAKLLFDKMPGDSVAVLIQLSRAKGSEELSADDDNTTREYLCFRAYLEAMDAFNTWFYQSMHAKPKEPVAPSGEKVTFKEQVAHEHDMQQYHQDVQRWQSMVTMLADTACECLYNVLLFVNGGWMVDQRSDGTPDANRQIQLSHLRKLCIPHIARLLQDLLIQESRFKEAVQLANTIASERYQLYKEFIEDDLKALMRVTLDASFSLLNRNMDPLGYRSQ